MQYSRPREPHSSPRRFQIAATPRENILDPLGVSSIRQCDEEMLSAPKHQNRRAVLTVALSADVYDYSQAKYKPRQRTKNSICDVEIKSRKPSREGHGSTLPVT